MAKRRAFEINNLLQISVGLFLITLGIAGLVHYNSSTVEVGRALSRLFGKANDPLNLIIAIVEVVAGAVVVLDLFVKLAGRAQFWLTLIILVLWVAQIVVFSFVNDILEPDVVTWLNRLSVDLIILVGLWIVNRKYA